MRNTALFTDGAVIKNSCHSLFNMNCSNAYNSSDVERHRDRKKRILKVFGRNIKQLRLKKNLTQEQLSEIAGINSKYLGEIERGEKNPTAIVICRLANALGVACCEILSKNGCQFKK